jgi:hypothetical protein
MKAKKYASKISINELILKAGITNNSIATISSKVLFKRENKLVEFENALIFMAIGKKEINKVITMEPVNGIE